ncbi:leucine-rich repeat-containing protein 4-like [Branchiostoma floridae]|uniref:Leucine-rich repeat-containing protein 4-like n=1 Tax=Branchiostoma floridae TaxID=7739 RepID=A0A9J7MXE7_BRAFL|nr:leucine-rich repeat-containing protein 4-like [Branchiostoma floridae]
MAATKLSHFLLLLVAFVPAKAGSSCPDLCEVMHTGHCRIRGMINIHPDVTDIPCAMCNTTGHADENQLGCLPATLKKLLVAGHSDSSGRLKPLPGLLQLYDLVLGPGHILTAESGTFSAVPNLLGLSMSNNAIKFIGTWFGGIRKLKKLDLSWNEIVEIQENALRPLVKLEFLNLLHNRLRAVEERFFAGLSNLMFLHLGYNNISHIAGKSIDRLPRLRALTLHHNRLSSISAESLVGIHMIQHVNMEANPYRCTCALDDLMSVGPRALGRVYSRLQCSYPPSLSGRKIADVERYEMPCPPPTAKVSRQNDGATLVCEVFWEKQPEIMWLDPGGRAVAVGERESPHLCGGTVTTSLEHDIPTTQSPEGGTTHSTSDSGLPYIGKSTSTLRLSQQAYRCWMESSFRCIVQSTPGSVTVDLPLTKPRETSEEGQSLQHTVTVDLPLTKPQETSKGGQSQHTTMAAVYTTTPVHVQQKARMSKCTVKSTKPHETNEGGQSLQHTTMAAVYTTAPVQQKARMSKPTVKSTKKAGTTAKAVEDWGKVLIVFIYIASAFLATFLLKKATVNCRFAIKCYKCHKKRQYRHRYVYCDAAGIPLQYVQPLAPYPALTTGNPPAPYPALTIGNRPPPVQNIYV